MAPIINRVFCFVSFISDGADYSDGDGHCKLHITKPSGCCPAMTHFDETSGIVPCTTPWGSWWQTMEEVCIEVGLPPGTTGKQVKCTIRPSSITVVVNGEMVIQGDFTKTIKADDSIWTIEDRTSLRICLPKVLPTADQCWKSLLKGHYEADPYVYDQMEKKLTLQRYQFENPGMDFSNADISGNYHGGGPQLPEKP